MTRRSSLILPSTLIALGLTLAACGDSDSEAPGDSTAPGSDTATTTAPAGDAAEATSDTLGSLPESAPVALPLDLVPGATAETADAGEVTTEWVAVADADALNTAVETAVADAATALETDGTGTELMVRADLIASGPGVLGVEVLAYEDGSTSDAAPATTIWWDGEQVVANEDLFAGPEDLEVVVGELSARLGVSGYSLDADADLTTELGALSFNGRGDVIADVRESALADGGAGERLVSVHAPARQSLSEFGQAAQDGVTEPTEFAADAAGTPQD